QTTQTRLDGARKEMTAAQAQETRMQGLLSGRARAAYEGGAGSALEVVLGATSFQDLTDRLEFVNSVVQSDAQVATAAEAARVRARQASIQLTQLTQQRQATLNKLGEKKSEIEAGIADQQALVDKLKTKVAQEAAAAAAAAAKAASQQQSNGGGGGPGPAPSPTQPAPEPSGGGGGGPPPDPGASTAVNAAFSVIGVPYQWGGSDPKTGFDCSGLTMWAWAQAGVSLPHSSAGQYDSVPHVSKDDLQPGDLLFFYQPISHVSIYVGGGMNIEALHTGTDVLEDAVMWQYF